MCSAHFEFRIDNGILVEVMLLLVGHLVLKLFVKSSSNTSALFHSTVESQKLERLSIMASPSAEPYVNLLAKICFDDSDSGWTRLLEEFCAANADSFVLEVKSKKSFLLLLLNKIKQLLISWKDSHCERKYKRHS